MKKFTKSEIDFLKENAKSYGAYICAQKMNRTFGSVLSKLKRERIPYTYKINGKSEKEIETLTFIDKERKVNYDFSTTDTPEILAYFMGFLWADGTINYDNAIIIEIMRKDGECLKNFFLKLCDFKIAYRKREGRQEQMSFYYIDKQFVAFLKEMGKYPHTSESHKKIFTYIPTRFQIYFMRGLIDGDGCFYLGKNKRNKHTYFPQFSIASNYEQDWSAIGSFLEKYGIKYTCYVQESKKMKSKASHIRVTGYENISRLIMAVYSEENGIYLERKHSIALEIIKKMNESKEIAKKAYPRYQLFKDGEYVENIEGPIIDYCNKKGFCYGNFARLTTHPDKTWRGYSLVKL